MPNVFLISDTHFGHHNMYLFTNEHGERIRPQYSNADEGDVAMIENWNRVVRPEDKVYHLGDVFIHRKARFVLDQLNGKKVLIKGNHDIFSLDIYTPFFYDIRAYHRLDKFVLSHIPIHRQSLEKVKGNIHGHLHAHRVLDNDGNPDRLYMSVCVEHINYTPIELSEVITYFNEL